MSFYSKFPPPAMMHLWALALMSMIDLLIIWGSRAATSLLMFISNSSKLRGLGVYTWISIFNLLSCKPLIPWTSRTPIKRSPGRKVRWARRPFSSAQSPPTDDSVTKLIVKVAHDLVSAMHCRTILEWVYNSQNNLTISPDLLSDCCRLSQCPGSKEIAMRHFFWDTLYKRSVRLG